MKIQDLSNEELVTRGHKARRQERAAKATLKAIREELCKRAGGFAQVDFPGEGNLSARVSNPNPVLKAQVDDPATLIRLIGPLASSYFEIRLRPRKEFEKLLAGAPYSIQNWLRESVTLEDSPSRVTFHGGDEQGVP